MSCAVINGRFKRLVEAKKIVNSATKKWSLTKSDHQNKEYVDSYTHSRACLIIYCCPASADVLYFLILHGLHTQELGFTSPQLRVVQHEVGRMFGNFVCSNCNRSWYSAYTWSGKGQECQRCLTMNLPKELRPLLRQGSSNPDRPHDEVHCQRCQELGHSCKNAPPVVVSVTTTVETQDDDEGDDDVSVACTDTSEDSNDANQDDATEDITPVGSEDEAERNENGFEKEMENLKLEN